MHFSALLAFAYQTLTIIGPRCPGLEPDTAQTRTEIRMKSTPEPPRLVFHPKPVESSLITFRHGDSNKESWQPWVDLLQTTVEPYEEGKQYAQHITMCSNRYSPNDKVCYVNIRHLGENCTKERFFGYDKGRPCVLIKLDEVTDWIPVTYDHKELPSDMPATHKERILRYNEEKMLWMTCDGESAADRENMGPVHFSPGYGIPTYYFPNNSTVASNFLSPLIMMEFLKPTQGVLIKIECKLWARNIDNNSAKSRGRTHFELLIDQI